MCAGHAAAEDTQLTQQPFQISLGSFTNSSEITIRADGENQEGTEFNWGDTIGDVDGTTFRLDSYWRINDRHHMRFMYTENSSNRTKILIATSNGMVKPSPSTLRSRSEFGFYVVEVAYEYDFSKREDRELVSERRPALHGILHRAHRHLRDTRRRRRHHHGRQRVELGAPLPVIGARGMWNLGGNWWLDGQVQFFQVAIDNIDGSILNYRAAVIWQPKQWLGFGVGYDSFGIDVDAEGKGERLKGKLEWT